MHVMLRFHSMLLYGWLATAAYSTNVSIDNMTDRYYCSTYVSIYLALKYILIVYLYIICIYVVVAAAVASGYAGIHLQG